MTAASTGSGSGHRPPPESDSFNRFGGRTVRSMKGESQRTCPSCGNEFSGAMEFCPVCMLRKCLAGGVESEESSLQEAIQSTSDAA